MMAYCMSFDNNSWFQKMYLYTHYSSFDNIYKRYLVFKKGQKYLYMYQRRLDLDC